MDCNKLQLGCIAGQQQQQKAQGCPDAKWPNLPYGLQCQQKVDTAKSTTASETTPDTHQEKGEEKENMTGAVLLTISQKGDVRCKICAMPELSLVPAQHSQVHSRGPCNISCRQQSSSLPDRLEGIPSLTARITSMSDAVSHIIMLDCIT